MAGLCIHEAQSIPLDITQNGTAVCQMMLANNLFGSTQICQSILCHRHFSAEHIVLQLANRMDVGTKISIFVTFITITPLYLEGINSGGLLPGLKMHDVNPAVCNNAAALTFVFPGENTATMAALNLAQSRANGSGAACTSSQGPFRPCGCSPIEDDKWPNMAEPSFSSHSIG